MSEPPPRECCGGRSGSFDPADQMDRYLRWVDEGCLSSTGECFDIGMTIHDSLMRYRNTGDPWAGSTDTYSAGNGSLMRLAAVPLFFARDPETGVRMSGESSRTTHGTAGTTAVSSWGPSREKIGRLCLDPGIPRWRVCGNGTPCAPKLTR